MSILGAEKYSGLPKLLSCARQFLGIPRYGDLASASAGQINHIFGFGLGNWEVFAALLYILCESNCTVGGGAYSIYI